MLQYFNELTKQSPFLAGVFGLFGAGILTYILKDVPVKIFNFIKKRLTTTLSVTNMNTSYYTLMDILNSDNLVNHIRNIKFYNGKWGSSCKVTKGIGAGTHIVKYRGQYLAMTVIVEKTQNQDDKLELNIAKFGRSHVLFDELKTEIETYDKRKNDMVSIYKYGNKDWIFMNDAKLRSFDTIIMSAYNKTKLINTIDKFLTDEEWFLSHGIPYQLGIFLQGESGTGKSSIIKAIASKYKLNICLLPANKLYSISDAVSQLPKDSLLVVEDIDANPAVSKRDGMEDEDADEKPKDVLDEDDDTDNVMITVEDIPTMSECENVKSENRDAYVVEKNYDLSEILNGIDGILSVHKRIMIMTSNRANILDPALKRPGRIDLELYITYVDVEMFIEFLHKFFVDKTNYINSIKDKILISNTKLTMSTLQNEYRQGKTIEQFVSEYCVNKE